MYNPSIKLNTLFPLVENLNVQVSYSYVLHSVGQKMSRSNVQKNVITLYMTPWATKGPAPVFAMKVECCRSPGSCDIPTALEEFISAQRQCRPIIKTVCLRQRSVVIGATLPLA